MMINPFRWSGFLFLMVLQVILPVSEAFPNNFVFKKYQVNDGLSENSVLSILQDQQGFMWFGTKDGLNRFDGREFRIYRKVTDDIYSIGNNFIRSIFEDRDGKLWTGTDNQLYIFNPLTEEFTLFDVTTNEGVGIRSGVTSICAENPDILWIGTMSQGVFMYEKSAGRLVQFLADGQASGLLSNIVWSVYKDLGGTIWVGTRGGLSRFNRETRSFTTYTRENSGNLLEDSEIMTIFEDAAGDLWLGTWSGGLAKLNRTTNQFSGYFGRNDSLYITHIRTVFEYSKDILLIGADDGLYSLHKPSGTVGEWTILWTRTASAIRMYTRSSVTVRTVCGSAPISVV